MKAQEFPVNPEEMLFGSWRNNMDFVITIIRKICKLVVGKELHNSDVKITCQRSVI